jgi:hypothetical protein
MFLVLSLSKIVIFHLNPKDKVLNNESRKSIFCDCFILPFS